MIRVLAFAGSSRKGSVNRRLSKVAVEAVRETGAEVTVIDLRDDFPLPLYDGDLETAEGVPENAHRFRDAIREHDALLPTCPEYNGGITPLLKNAIDWASRRDRDGQSGGAAFRGKVAALTSASPGAFGGMNGLVWVRALLTKLGVLVLPIHVCLPHAGKAFDDEGKLTDAAVAERLTDLATELVRTTEVLKRG